MKIAQAVLLGLIGVTTAAETPSGPVWPETFSQSFNETFVYADNSTRNTTGMFFYDVSDKNATNWL